MTLILSGFISSLIANLISAFAGGGSSLVLFPLLLLTTSQTYISSLVVAKASAVALTLTSGAIHLKKAKMSQALLLVCALFGLLGTAIGTYLLQFQFNEILFKKMLAVSILLTVIYLIYSKNTGLKEDQQRLINCKVITFTALFCLFSNILNGLFGGTGIFLTIYLVLYLRLSFKQAIAYTMTSYALVNLLQAIYLLITEDFNLFLLLGVLIGAVIGSYFGTHLLYIQGNKWVKLAAVSMMCIISLLLIKQIYS